MRWFGLAAAQGDPTANNNLGYLYETGTGTPQNYQEAVTCYQKAIADPESDPESSSLAKVHLASLYERGLGVPKNSLEAERLYSEVIGTAAEEATFPKDVSADDLDVGDCAAWRLVALYHQKRGHHRQLEAWLARLDGLIAFFRQLPFARDLCAAACLRELEAAAALRAKVKRKPAASKSIRIASDGSSLSSSESSMQPPLRVLRFGRLHHGMSSSSSEDQGSELKGAGVKFFMAVIMVVMSLLNV